MRLLRSDYLQQQEYFSTTTTTTSTVTSVLKVQPNITESDDDNIATTSAKAAIADSLGASSSTTTQVLSQRITARRKSHYVIEQQEAIKMKVTSSQQPQSIKERRKTVSNCSNLSHITCQAMTEQGQINLRFFNVPPGCKNLKLIFDFSAPPLTWYNEVYKSYQNDLWKKIRREIPTKKSKWQYECRVCKKVLGAFTTIKNHLNIHMGWMPHLCADCPKKYPSRNSILRHHHTTYHRLEVPIRNVKKNNL